MYLRSRFLVILLMFSMFFFSVENVQSHAMYCYMYELCIWLFNLSDYLLFETKTHELALEGKIYTL